MFELNQTSAYEPMPAFNCEHSWMHVGEPIKYWSSAGTGDAAPDNAPIKQKQKCMNCGGVEWHDLRT